MKFTIATFLLAATFVAINAQYSSGVKAVGVYPPSDYFTNILNMRAQILLNTPDFPADLQQRVQQTMAAAQAGFDECNSSAYRMPWMQRVCIAMQFSNSQNQLTAIEDEWNARVAASSTPAAAV